MRDYERHVRVKCLVQNHNAVPSRGSNPDCSIRSPAHYTTRSKRVKCAWKACETHVKSGSRVKHTCEIKLHQDLVSFTCMWNTMWNIIQCVKLNGIILIFCWACETACEKKELCETCMWNKIHQDLASFTRMWNSICVWNWMKKL